MSKTLGENSDLRIAPPGGQSGHVEQAAYLFAAAGDAGFAHLDSGLTIKGSYAYQGGDFMTIEFSQFGQMSDEHSAGLRANARGAAQDSIFVTEVIVALNVVLNEIVELTNLGLEGFDHFADAITNFEMMCHFGTVGFLGKHVGELSPSADQFGQELRLWLSGRPIGGFDHLAETSEDFGIDGVGLGVFAQTFCEMTHLTGIDHDRLESGLDQFGSESAFVSAGCFQDDLGDIEALQSGQELSVAFSNIGVITLELGWAGGDLEGIFGDVNSDIERFGHGSTPFLPMRAWRRVSPLAQAAVRVNPTATTRTKLRVGLDDPVTIGLTSSVAGSARCAPLCPGLRFARLADNNVIYGIF